MVTRIKTRRKSRKNSQLRALIPCLIVVNVIVWSSLLWSESHKDLNTNNALNLPRTLEQSKAKMKQEAKAKIIKRYGGVAKKKKIIQIFRNCTSWRDCFIENHTCAEFCREGPITTTSSAATNTNSMTQDWIPDVTMLRKMFINQKDENGNPWPPPLDDELCEPMGEDGTFKDEDLEVLDVVGVRAKPISRELNTGTNKLLCLVYTMEKTHNTNIRAIRETWGPGCDGFLAFSTVSDPSIPAIHLDHQGDEDYNNMWQKVRSIWKFVGEHYLSQFDWFYIGGEDMFPLIQDLKDYFGTFNSSESYYLGKRYKTYEKQLFNTGGSGYALSRPSLKCLAQNLDNSLCQPNRRISQEDVMVGQCLIRACNVYPYDTRDSKQRERFHHFLPSWHYKWRPKKVKQKVGKRFVLKTDWYTRYNEDWGVMKGKDALSPETLAFHYVKKPAHVRHFFHYLHDCKWNATIRDRPFSKEHEEWKRLFHGLHGRVQGWKSTNVQGSIAQAKQISNVQGSTTQAKQISAWYGWQPKIASSMECSWRRCFVDDHSCSTCRDRPEEMSMGEELLSSPVPEGWVPDVTMLRRMYVEGKDAQGNPWPPPLDDELCEPIGLNGTLQDIEKDALDNMTITAAEISKENNTASNRVLCLVYTIESSHGTSIRAIRETWAPGCDGFLAFSTVNDPRIPAIHLHPIGGESYKNMWQKVRQIWNFVAKHYKSQFDWFFLGGEDMLLLPQNLKDFLSTFNSSESYYLGRRFTNARRIRFNTGGPGYVLSRSTLQCLVDNLESSRCMPNHRTSEEDVRVAQCLQNACSIGVHDTRDVEGRERFHHFTPSTQYLYRPKPMPRKRWEDWFADFNVEWGIKVGQECCAPDSVSFHYIKNSAQMRHLFHYLHSCKRGRQRNLQ